MQRLQERTSSPAAMVSLARHGRAWWPAPPSPAPAASCRPTRRTARAARGRAEVVSRACRERHRRALPSASAEERLFAYDQADHHAQQRASSDRVPAARPAALCGRHRRLRREATRSSWKLAVTRRRRQRVRRARRRARVNESSRQAGHDLHLRRQPRRRPAPSSPPRSRASRCPTCSNAPETLRRREHASRSSRATAPRSPCRSATSVGRHAVHLLPGQRRGPERLGGRQQPAVDDAHARPTTSCATCVEIRVSTEAQPPANPGEGMEYPNSPNVGILGAAVA